MSELESTLREIARLLAVARLGSRQSHIVEHLYTMQGEVEKAIGAVIADEIYFSVKRDREGEK